MVRESVGLGEDVPASEGIEEDRMSRKKQPRRTIGITAKQGQQIIIECRRRSTVGLKLPDGAVAYVKKTVDIALPTG